MLEQDLERNVGRKGAGSRCYNNMVWQRVTNIGTIINELGRCDLLPAIVFRTSRSQCDADVIKAATQPRLSLSVIQQRDIRYAVRDIISRYDMDEELIVTHPQYGGLISTGVGAHHAGQLLMWRLLLEELMATGKLRVLVATGTVAAGVDFPARTVVITAHSRRGAQGYSTLTAAEFQQMSGRAGRRGKDTVGFCIAAPSQFCDARELLKISKKPPEPLKSAYFPSPSTILNLLRYRNVDDLRFTVGRSLASYMDKKEAELCRQQADELEKENALVSANATSDDGVVDDCDDSVITDGEDGQASANAKSKASHNARQRMKKKIRRLRKKADELEKIQVDLLEVTLKGLQELGYVEDVSLSAKGYWSANLCTNLVLELGEIIEKGLINDASYERLVAVIGSLCGEEHRQYLKGNSPILSKEDIKVLEQTIANVTSKGMPGVVETRKVLPEAAFTVLAWLSSKDWHSFRSLLALAGAPEGDAARLIIQTAEHLNQITRLSQSHPALALRAEEAKRRILRPPLSDVMTTEGAM